MTPNPLHRGAAFRPTASKHPSCQTLDSMQTDPTLGQSQRNQHRRIVVVPILLILVEVYCMFPFESKGDFAEIGTFVVNGIGSLVFIVRGLIVIPVIATRWSKQGLLGTGSVMFLLATYFTPLLTYAVRYVTQPTQGFTGAVAAYLAGPQDRGRDAHCWAPPAQIRACAIHALGSHLGCLTAKRSSGQG